MKTIYMCGWYEPQEHENTRDARCACQAHCANWRGIGCAILSDEKRDESTEEDAA